MKWIQTSEYCKNSEVFCRKKPYTGCETLRKMGNCDMTKGTS
jgi:hypothetical protein